MVDKMTRIFKYNLKITDNQFLETKHHVVKILKVAEQNEQLTLWAMVDTSITYDKIGHIISIYGTGSEIQDEQDEYIDSVLMSNGLVWHVFNLGYVK